MTATDSQHTTIDSTTLTFTDTKGRKWNTALNVASVRRVRERLKVDLLQRDLPKVLEGVYGDSVKLCDVLYLVSNENAPTKERVSDEDFGRAMSGDSIEEGGVALLNAIRDFTPNPRARARVGQFVEKILSAMEHAQDEADRAAAEVFARIDAIPSGLTSSDSPESPESSPGSTPSAS